MKKILLSILCFTVICFIASAESTQLIDTLSIPTKNISPSPLKVTVALPEYYVADNDTATYPVIYLLNGFSGDHRDYASHFRLDSLATVYEAIIVCPDGRDSWYWDSPVDPNLQMESFFINDLVPTIDSLFRTRPDRNHRAIAGLSMGGHGALWLAIRHSDIWAHAGSMSGGVDITPDKFHRNWKMAKRLGNYNSAPGRWNRHTVMNLVPTLSPDQIDIILMCGLSDIFINENDHLDTYLTEQEIPHLYITAPGGHSWDYWTSALPVILDFFSTFWEE